MSLSVLNAGQNYYIRGGSEQYQFALTELLESHGHQVTPFAARNSKNRATPYSQYFPQGTNFDNPSIQDLMQFVYSKPANDAIQRLLGEVTIDLAHLHIYYGQLTTSILKPLQKAGIPIVQTLHEYKIICPVYTLLSHGEICQACEGKDFWHATRKRCNRGSLARSALSTLESYTSKALGSIRKIDHFIAVSDFLRNKVIDLGLPANKVTTIHHAFDASGIEPNIEPGEYFLYFGRLERLKGLFTLIEAAAPLKDIPLLIVGDGEARLELERLIASRDLNHIQILGFKRGQDLENLIRNSICTLIPSEWYEPFGLTLIESFARGRPVIASKIGGIEEIVTHNVDGYLVSPGNVEQIREQMLWMAQHRSMAVEMGLLGRQKVENLFSPEMHYEKLMKVYQKVL